MTQRSVAMLRQPQASYQYPPVTEALLAEIVEKIRSVGSPLKIVLFGSRAAGAARPDSDIDLLIIERQRSDSQAASLKYYNALRGVFPEFNILVHSPRDVAEWRNVPNHLITAALASGRILFEDATQSVYFPTPGTVSKGVGGAVAVCETIEPKNQHDLVREWLALADDDLATARLIAAQGARLSHACFHAQQAIEKYLKDLILLHGLPFPRTHDLEELLQQCRPLAALSGIDAAELAQISHYYISCRYTSQCPSRSETEAALRVAEQVRSAVLAAVPPEARPEDR